MREQQNDFEKPEQGFALDDEVHVLPLDKPGRIVAIEKNGVYRVQVNGQCWELESSKLRIWERAPESPPPVRIAENVTFHASLETSLIGPAQSIDLHGLRVAEALRLVERAIDQALVARFRYLDLVHGIGTGQIKRALDKFLAQKVTEDLIERYELSTLNPGETRVFF